MFLYSGPGQPCILVVHTALARPCSPLLALVCPLAAARASETTWGGPSSSIDSSSACPPLLGEARIRLVPLEEGRCVLLRPA